MIPPGLPYEKTRIHTLGRISVRRIHISPKPARPKPGVLSHQIGGPLSVDPYLYIDRRISIPLYLYTSAPDSLYIGETSFYRRNLFHAQLAHGRPPFKPAVEATCSIYIVDVSPGVEPKGEGRRSIHWLGPSGVPPRPGHTASTVRPWAWRTGRSTADAWRSVTTVPNQPAAMARPR